MTSKFPRLRVHVRRRRDGQVRAYYFYDMRPEGQPDIPLGRDHAEALKKWDELHNHRPRIAGTLMEAFERWEREVLPTYENKYTRDGYTRNLRQIKPVFGPATWDSVKFPHLVAYLQKRSAKTQGNREIALLSIIWNKARAWGLTELPYPAAGLAKSRWKNKETPREFEVTDEVFEAIYAEAEPMLRDCMDLATATGMRLTDCRTIPMPRGDALRLKAVKTGKKADFDISLSSVLPELIERRRALGAKHTMLLSMPDGSPVTYSMLRGAYDRARARAALVAVEAGNEELAQQVKAMFLRDLRKRAADLVGDVSEASKLLQHSSERVTRVHYMQRAQRLKPAR